jgi:hypothetical protein
MAREYKVMASNNLAIYTAGTFYAESAEEAIEMAKRDYARSYGGRFMGDDRDFRYYVVDGFPDEEED